MIVPHRFVILWLILCFAISKQIHGQENYNNCSQALMLCPNESFTLNNIDANVTFCPDCEDDLTFCFTSNNSIWLKIKTNTTGGVVNFDFSNLVFNNQAGQDQELNAVLLSAIVPCDAGSYAMESLCYTNQNGNFTLVSNNLLPETIYYLLVSGDNSGPGITVAAEATFDLIVSGPGIDRPVPLVALGASSTNICKDELLTFYTSLNNCTDTSQFYWFVNDDLRAITDSAYWQTTEIQNGDTVAVQVSCFLDCPDTLRQDIGPISVFSFNVDAGPDQEIFSGDGTNLEGNTVADTISWSPDLFLSDTEILNPFTIPENDITYTLAATLNGCTIYDQVLITLKDNLIIATTFSPNDDGINDTWIIKGIEKYPNNILKIYDRWGQIVFQTTGYTAAKAWTGKEGNKTISEGVYFYSLDLRDSNSENLRGSITLIR